VPVADNAHGLRTGASWEAGVGAAREIWKDWFVLIGRVGWLHRNRDSFRGTPVLVGGGDWINVSPGVSATAGRFTLQAEARLPVHRSLDNRQLDSPKLLQAGLLVRVF
jgi:hypothetical protein